MIAFSVDLSDERTISVLKFLDVKFGICDVPIKELTPIEDVTLISRLFLSEYQIPSKEIKREIQTKRNNYHLIEVEAKTASLASFAARDGRVDMVRLNPKMGLGTYNARYANRLLEHDKLVSFELGFLYQKHPASTLRQILRILAAFGSKHVSVTLIQPALDIHQIRSYRGIQAIGKIMGLSRKQTSARHLLKRIEVNKKKLNGKIPFPGVEIDGSKD